MIDWGDCFKQLSGLKPLSNNQRPSWPIRTGKPKTERVGTAHGEKRKKKYPTFYYEAPNKRSDFMQSLKTSNGNFLMYNPATDTAWYQDANGNYLKPSNSDEFAWALESWNRPERVCNVQIRQTGWGYSLIVANGRIKSVFCDDDHFTFNQYINEKNGNEYQLANLRKNEIKALEMLMNHFSSIEFEMQGVRQISFVPSHICSWSGMGHWSLIWDESGDLAVSVEETQPSVYADGVELVGGGTKFVANGAKAYLVKLRSGCYKNEVLAQIVVEVIENSVCSYNTAMPQTMAIQSANGLVDMG